MLERIPDENELWVLSEPSLYDVVCVRGFMRHGPNRK